MKAVSEKDLLPGKGVRILAEHEIGLLAFFKPAGVLSHPNTSQDIPRSLLKTEYNLEDECYELEGPSGGDPVRVWLLNRLDSATSGVLLCALHEPLARIVRQQFVDGKVEKKYFALVFGSLSPAKQVWRDRLQVSHDAGRLRVSAKGGAEAETEVRLERFFPGRYPVSLIELRPKTGRTHQLRVQCAKRKLPIVGDQTYGNFGWNREFARATKQKRLFLHSAEIRTAFKVDGDPVTFSARAPLPKEFTP